MHQVCLLDVQVYKKKIFKETRGPHAPEYQTLYTDFLSEGLIFAYLEAHGGYEIYMQNAHH